MRAKILKRSFYQRETVTVAKDLLGKVLVSELYDKPLFGVIAETEAYRSDDAASHMYKGKTQKNAVLFGQVGYSYVYIAHGLYNCFNFVARDIMKYPAGGILLRALIPCDSLDQALKDPFLHYKSIIKGPGNTGKYLRITLDDSGIDLTNQKSPLKVIDAPSPESSLIKVSTRIGITKDVERLWRFFIKL
jgi:DNA-3-methyladenine glycosylase